MLLVLEILVRVYLTGYYLRVKKLHVFFVMDNDILFVQSIGYEILGRIIYCYCKIHFSNGKLFGCGDAWYAMLNGYHVWIYISIFVIWRLWPRKISDFTWI